MLLDIADLTHITDYGKSTKDLQTEVHHDIMWRIKGTASCTHDCHAESPRKHSQLPSLTFFRCG